MSFDPSFDDSEALSGVLFPPYVDDVLDEVVTESDVFSPNSSVQRSSCSNHRAPSPPHPQKSSRVLIPAAQPGSSLPRSLRNRGTSLASLRPPTLLEVSSSSLVMPGEAATGTSMVSLPGTVGTTESANGTSPLRNPLADSEPDMQVHFTGDAVSVGGLKVTAAGSDCSAHLLITDPLSIRGVRGLAASVQQLSPYAAHCSDSQLPMGTPSREDAVVPLPLESPLGSTPKYADLKRSSESPRRYSVSPRAYGSNAIPIRKGRSDSAMAWSPSSNFSARSLARLHLSQVSPTTMHPTPRTPSNPIAEGSIGSYTSALDEVWGTASLTAAFQYSKSVSIPVGSASSTSKRRHDSLRIGSAPMQNHRMGLHGAPGARTLFVTSPTVPGLAGGAFTAVTSTPSTPASVGAHGGLSAAMEQLRSRQRPASSTFGTSIACSPPVQRGNTVSTATHPRARRSMSAAPFSSKDLASIVRVGIGLYPMALKRACKDHAAPFAAARLLQPKEITKTSSSCVTSSGGDQTELEGEVFTPTRPFSDESGFAQHLHEEKAQQPGLLKAPSTSPRLHLSPTGQSLMCIPPALSTPHATPARGPTCSPPSQNGLNSFLLSRNPSATMSGASSPTPVILTAGRPRNSSGGESALPEKLSPLVSVENDLKRSMDSSTDAIGQWSLSPTTTSSSKDTSEELLRVSSLKNAKTPVTSPLHRDIKSPVCAGTDVRRPRNGTHGFFSSVLRSILPSPDIQQQQQRGSLTRSNSAPQTLADLSCIFPLADPAETVSSDSDSESHPVFISCDAVAAKELVSMGIHGEKVRFEDLVDLDFLGNGAHGSVLKVQHRPTGKLFALKRVPLSFLEAASVRLSVASAGGAIQSKQLQVVRELHVLANQAHSPHIIRYFDAFYIDLQLCILMEYMDIGHLLDLADLIGEKQDETDHVLSSHHPLQENVLAAVAIQCLEGLHYMHDELNLAHRDIKPQNILVSTSGVVKLADFGISVNLSETGKISDHEVGTTAFMSPERHRGKDHDATCDIWSLGVTLAYAALGHYPHDLSRTEREDSGPFDLLDIISQPIVFPPERSFSEEFKNFISSATSNVVSERPSASQLLWHPWLQGYRSVGFPNLALVIAQAQKKKECAALTT